MIWILDVTSGHLFYCDNESEARMVRRMLDLVGSEHQTLVSKQSKG